MKYLCKELREQYEISVKECGEINELQYPLIGMGDVLRAYYILADYFTDDSGGARRMVKKKDHSYHVSPTMKEFIAALEGANITTRLENGKIHLRREVKRPWPFKPETINYSIGFAGWSRSVGAKTAREVLQKLKLYEEYPDYQDFLEGKEVSAQ